MNISEHQLQSLYFDWVRIMREQDRRYKLIAAIPNGGHRHISVAKKLKREGVSRGLPDVFNFWMTSYHTGLVLEFKVGKNGLTEDQEYWFKLLREQNWRCEEVRDFESAKQLTLEHFSE
jgi:hypothetical protein